jgi:hypothetical protein
MPPGPEVEHELGSRSAIEFPGATYTGVKVVHHPLLFSRFLADLAKIVLKYVTEIALRIDGVHLNEKLRGIEGESAKIKFGGLQGGAKTLKKLHRTVTSTTVRF